LAFSASIDKLSLMNNSVRKSAGETGELGGAGEDLDFWLGGWIGL